MATLALTTKLQDPKGELTKLITSLRYFLYSGNTEINLPVLLKMLYPLNNKWKAIGKELGLSADIMMQIEKRHNPHDDNCLVNVLDKWLKNDAEPTWTTIYSVVNSRQVGGSRIAQKILEEYEQAVQTVIEE